MIPIFKSNLHILSIKGINTKKYHKWLKYRVKDKMTKITNNHWPKFKVLIYFLLKHTEVDIANKKIKVHCDSWFHVYIKCVHIQESKKLFIESHSMNCILSHELHYHSCLFKFRYTIRYDWANLKKERKSKTTLSVPN